MARVIIVEDAEIARQNIVRAFSMQSSVEIASEFADVDALLVNTSPEEDINKLDAILIAQRLLGENLEILPKVMEYYTDVAIIVMGTDSAETEQSRIIDAGVKAYLAKPFSVDELLTTLADVVPAFVPTPVAKSADLADDKNAAAVVIETISTSSAQTTPLLVPPAGMRVITLVGTKGGIGKSVVATNLATLIAQATSRRVALVDLHPQGGDLAELLQVQPQHTLADFGHGEDVELDEVRRLFTSASSGLQLIAAPFNANAGEHLHSEHVLALIGHLRELVDYVVIDTATHVDAILRESIHASDGCVLLSGMSALALHASEETIKLLKELEVADERCLVVLNRNEANSDFTNATVEERLGRHVTLQLPFDPILVSNSVNRGVPFVTEQPDASVSGKIRELAQAIIPLEELASAATETALKPDKKGDKKRGLFRFART